MIEEESKFRRELTGHVSAAAAYSIFGLNIIFSQDITACGIIPPMALYSMRSVGACLLFWLLSLMGPKEKVAAGDFPKIAIASFLGLLVPQVTFLYACNYTTAIDMAIMSSLAPVFTMIVAAIAVKEPITVKKASGVAISFAGVTVLILNSAVQHSGGVDATTPLGVCLMLLNGLGFAFYLGIFRPLIAKYSVVTFMKWMFLFSTLLPLPFSVRELVTTHYELIPVNVIWEIAFIVFFATFVAYFLIPLAQQRIRPTLVGMYSYLQPVVAMIISVIIGMDHLSWQKTVCVVLIFTGVVIVNRSRAASH